MFPPVRTGEYLELAAADLLEVVRSRADDILVDAPGVVPASDDEIRVCRLVEQATLNVSEEPRFQYRDEALTRACSAVPTLVHYLWSSCLGRPCFW